MKKIITSSTSKFRVIDSVTDASGNKIPIIYGPLSFEEVPSQKGYRYRSGFWQKALSNPAVEDSIKNHSMLGMIEHPVSDEEYFKTPYDKASHVVWNVEIKDGVPYGTMALVNNQYGNSIKALADLGVPIGVSTRGLGDYCQDSVSEYIDEDSYALITWDFTRNPNLQGASMSKITDSFMQTPLFKQFVEAYQLRDSVDESYSRDKLKAEMAKMRDVMKEQLEKLNSMYNSI